MKIKYGDWELEIEAKNVHSKDLTNISFLNHLACTLINARDNMKAQGYDACAANYQDELDDVRRVINEEDK